MNGPWRYRIKINGVWYEEEFEYSTPKAVLHILKYMNWPANVEEVRPVENFEVEPL